MDNACISVVNINKIIIQIACHAHILMDVVRWVRLLVKEGVSQETSGSITFSNFTPNNILKRSSLNKQFNGVFSDF